MSMRSESSGRKPPHEKGGRLSRISLQAAFSKSPRRWLRDVRDMRLAQTRYARDAVVKQMGDVERQIESLLDGVVEATSPSVVTAYEARIEKLERQKFVLSEKAEKTIPPKGRMEDCIKLALRSLSTPWILYNNGDFCMRQTVLRLAFSEPLRYSQNGAYGTPEFSSLSST